MKVQFLGYGGAFDWQYGNSSVIVETEPDLYLLINCGCTVFSRLMDAGLAPKISAVLITHMHDDHMGSLGSLMNYTYHLLGRRLNLLLPPKLREPIQQLVAFQHTRGPATEKVAIHDLLTTMGSEPIVGNTMVDWIDTYGLHQANMPTYGYVVRQGSDTIAYSGDIADPNAVFSTLAERGYQGAIVFHDTCFSRNQKAHTYYEDLYPHLDRWKVVAYHNDPRAKPADCRLPLAWEMDEFKLVI